MGARGHFAKSVRNGVVACAAACALIFLAIVYHYYPSRVDPPEAIHFQPTGEQQEFYDSAFAARQARYAEIARQSAVRNHIREGLQEFVANHQLNKAHVLEIGS